MIEKVPRRLDDYDKINGSHAKRKSRSARRIERIKYAQRTWRREVNEVHKIGRQVIP